MNDLEKIRLCWSKLVEDNNHTPNRTPSDPLAQRNTTEMAVFQTMLCETLPGCDFEIDGDTLIINNTIVVTP